MLDIDSRMGNDTQLGHTSSLQSGQVVPDGAHYQGSPAEATSVDFDRAGRLPASLLRRAGYTAFQLVMTLAVAVPVPLTLLDLLFPGLFDSLREQVTGFTAASVSPALFGWVIVWATATYFGMLLGSLALLGNRAAPCQSLPQAWRQLSDVRISLRAAAGGNALLELARVQPAVRRQLVHRALPATGRL